MDGCTQCILVLHETGTAAIPVCVRHITKIIVYDGTNAYILLSYYKARDKVLAQPACHHAINFKEVPFFCNQLYHLKILHHISLIKLAFFNLFDPSIPSTEVKTVQ